MTEHEYPTFTATDDEVEGWKNDSLTLAVRRFVEAIERSKSNHQIVTKNGPTHVRLRMALDATKPAIEEVIAEIEAEIAALETIQASMPDVDWAETTRHKRRLQRTLEVLRERRDDDR